MRCPNPQCYGFGPFHIHASGLAEVGDEGVLGFRDINWDLHSLCICGNCTHSGEVKDFVTENVLELVEETDEKSFVGSIGGIFFH